MEITYDSLLKNATDYFSDSVTFYRSNTYKNAVLSLWSGVLLLLKCKLFKIHPALIVSKIENCLKINNGTLELIAPNFSENITTVTLADIEKRIRILKLPNTVYKSYETSLRKIHKARNQAEHCVCQFSENDLLKMFLEAIPFLNDFLEKELEIDPVDVFENWEDFIEIETVATARKKNVKEFNDEHFDYEKAKQGIEQICGECSQCGSQAIDIGDGLLTCKMCGNKESYHICNECGGVFTENGFTSFIEDVGMCYDCFCEKSGMNDDD